jgi:hypothetical protein
MARTWFVIYKGQRLGGGTGPMILGKGKEGAWTEEEQGMVQGSHLQFLGLCGKKK